MRIVCDSCGTKYSISDEKVRGKLFKFRCKNCSHVIIVRGHQDEAGEDDGDERTAAHAGSGGGEEWFYVLDGQQAGPVSTDEVASLVADGDILADTYMWREGMDDWLHIADIPELSHLAGSVEGWNEEDDLAAGNGHDVSPAVFAGSGEDEVDYSDEEEATRVTSAPAAEPERSSRGGLGSAGLGSAGLRGDRPPERLAPSYAGGADPFDEPAPPSRPGSGGGGGLFGGGEGLGLSTASEGENEERMVGQRNENSVLFSLDNLQSVDAGDSNGSDLPTTEGSGLIDIKALAASQAATGGSGLDGDSMSHDQPMATPAMMPMGQRQSHKLLYGLIGAGALIILGLVAAIVVVLTNDTEGTTQQVGDNQVAAAPTPEASQATPPAPDPTAETAMPTPPLTEVPAAAGPTADQTRGATASGALMAAGLANRAQDVAELIANRPSPRVSDRGDRGDRGERTDRTDRTARPERTEATPTEEVRSGRPRDRGSRETPSTGDPVSDALSQIRGGNNNNNREEPEAQEEEPPPSRGTLPESLNASDISRSIRNYNRRLAECRTQSNLPSGEVLRVDVSMTIQGNGRVASARSDSSDPGAGCIVDVVRDMRFDEFSGEAMNFTYPFRVR